MHDEHRQKRLTDPIKISEKLLDALPMSRPRIIHDDQALRSRRITTPPRVAARCDRKSFRMKHFRDMGVKEIGQDQGIA